MPQDAQQIKAIDVRHSDVGQHDIDGWRFIEQVSGLLRRKCWNRDVPRHLEEDCYGLSGVAIIVDYEDSKGRFSSFLRVATFGSCTQPCLTRCQPFDLLCPPGFGPGDALDEDDRADRAVNREFTPFSALRTRRTLGVR